MPHFLIELLGKEYKLPTYLVQVTRQRIKHILILHFELCVDRLPLNQGLLRARTQRSKGRTKFAILDSLSLVFIKAEYEQFEVILRKVNTKALKILDQEVLEFLVVARALATDVD